MASASTPPMPSITHGPNWGSVWSPAISSRLPVTMGITRSSTVPSSGRARPRSSPAASRTASASTSRRRTRPRSVLWAIAGPHSFTTTGNPSWFALTPASLAVGTVIPGTVATPCVASSCFEAASESVVVAGAAEGIGAPTLAVRQPESEATRPHIAVTVDHGPAHCRRDRACPPADVEIPARAFERDREPRVAGQPARRLGAQVRTVLHLAAAGSISDERLDIDVHHDLRRCAAVASRALSLL